MNAILFGVIIQFGGQTPLKLAADLAAEKVPILGTQPEAIARAEDRSLFNKVLKKLSLQAPQNITVTQVNEGIKQAERLGYPLLLRPSYVLGGRAMEIVYDKKELERYLCHAVQVSEDTPVQIDRFLDDAVEVDVDVVSDGNQVMIAGMMEHIEQAGVHSGDSACALPTYTLKDAIRKQLADCMQAMALELGVVGLMNAQFAIKNDTVYVLEANPRASRTVPFVSKAIGIPLAKVAAKCMMGVSLHEQGYNTQPEISGVAVKVAIFPFNKFPGVDPILGPEMKSTGEVMGWGEHFALAYSKAQAAGGICYQAGGKAFISVRDGDKAAAVAVANDLQKLGFSLVATHGTADYLQQAGVSCAHINKVIEGRPHVVDLIKNGEIHYIVNTTEGRRAIADSFTIRRSALQKGVHYTTTVAGARADIQAFEESKQKKKQAGKVTSLQERIN